MVVVDCEEKEGELRCCGEVVSTWFFEANQSIILMWMSWRQEGGGGDLQVFMGKHKSKFKFKTWDLLEALHMEDDEHLPWLCAGNFNEILFHHEKEGGVPRAQVCLDLFKNALEVCELGDLGFVGDVFTWRNKQMKGSTHIREMLDRAVANTEWRMKFPLVHVKNGDPFHSDHRPVVVQTEKFQEHASGGGPKAFRFEASWLQELDCRKIIEEAWGAL